MKVIIAGAGAVGAFLAEDLANAGHIVTLIEKNISQTERIPTADNLKLMESDACEVDTLQRADLVNADVVVATTGDDEDNLVISLLAKQEFAVPRVIARVNNPANHWMFNQSWGVDIAVSTPHLLSALVQEAVSVGSLVKLFQFDKGNAHLIEVTLAEQSTAIGMALTDMTLPRRATVVAIIRDGQVIVPRGDTVLNAGDEVMLLAMGNCEDEVREMLVGTDER
jgi:trk system potassium uptake protein TrkA